jgi:hypothetical protein
MYTGYPSTRISKRSNQDIVHRDHQQRAHPNQMKSPFQKPSSITRPGDPPSINIVHLIHPLPPKPPRYLTFNFKYPSRSSLSLSLPHTLSHSRLSRKKTFNPSISLSTYIHVHQEASSGSKVRFGSGRFVPHSIRPLLRLFWP